MSDFHVQIRCQRCGSQMTLTDPIGWQFGQTWPAQQFWKCAECGRNFWTTYTAPKPPPPPKPAAPPEGAATPPAQSPPAAGPDSK